MRKIFLILAVVSALAGVVFAKAPQNDSRRAKARHFLLESAVQKMNGHSDAAYELARRAYRTDRSYDEAAHTFGLYSLGVPSTDTTGEYTGSFGLMRAYIDNHPEDYIGSRRYSTIAYQLGKLDEARRIYERNESIFPEKSEDLLNLANVYIALDSIPAAIKAIDRYENLEGKSAMLSIHKISMYLSRMDTTAALKEADELIEYNPGDPENHIVKGNTFLFINLPDSAFRYFERAEKVDPESGRAKIAMANYWMQKGDTTKYDNKIYEALLANDFDMDDKMSMLMGYMAKLLSDKSNSERAAMLFKSLTDQYPHEPEVMWLASEYSAVKHDFDDAAEKISYALDMSPDNIQYWEKLMQYRMGAERYDLAEQVYNTATTKVTPSDGMDYLLAASYQLSERYDDAIGLYDRLIRKIDSRFGALDSLHTDADVREIAPNMRGKMSSLYTSTGDVLQLKKDTAGTFKAYGNAIAFYPDNTLALNNYAYLLAESGGDLKEAERMAGQAIRIETENPVYLDTYAWILFKQGEYTEALPYQSIAVEKSADEPSAELFDHFGDILFKAGEPERALENWNKALELDPDNELIKRKVTNKTYYEN